MSHTEQQPIEIHANDGSNCPGLWQLTHYDQRERFIRAGKQLALYWALALLSIPILVAHWILVPAFFLAGPVMAYLRFRMTQRSDHATGHCPVNQHEISIPLKAAERLPQWKYCPVCRAPLQLLAHPKP